MAGKLNTSVYPTRAEHGLQLRIQLLALLSPTSRCAACSLEVEIEDLEVGHVDGRTWLWHSLNALDRIRREWREYFAGVPLRALCRRCNGSDGVRFRGRPRYAPDLHARDASELRAA